MMMTMGPTTDIGSQAILTSYNCNDLRQLLLKLLSVPWCNRHLLLDKCFVFDILWFYVKCHMKVLSITDIYRVNLFVHCSVYLYLCKRPIIICFRNTDNPLFTNTRYNDDIRYNDNLTVKKPSLKR